MKNLLLVLGLLISLTSYSQYKVYKCDMVIKMVNASDSPTSGDYEGAHSYPIEIRFNQSKNTVTIVSTDENLQLMHLENVRFKETFTSPSGDVYKAYYCTRDGDPYFISFSDDLITMVDRTTKKVWGFRRI